MRGWYETPRYRGFIYDNVGTFYITIIMYIVLLSWTLCISLVPRLTYGDISQDVVCDVATVASGIRTLTLFSVIKAATGESDPAVTETMIRLRSRGHRYRVRVPLTRQYLEKSSTARDTRDRSKADRVSKRKKEKNKEDTLPSERAAERVLSRLRAIAEIGVPSSDSDSDVPADKNASVSESGLSSESDSNATSEFINMKEFEEDVGSYVMSNVIFNRFLFGERVTGKTILDIVVCSLILMILACLINKIVSVVGRMRRERLVRQGSETVVWDITKRDDGDQE
ncbi:b42 [miniopterid betaherpesvirus 1]|uniref:B42 n=1 Tax=miniopterid betaherpesvirus 1 TaxID=3070189 RepID=I3VQ23_9BETA|nr:b42 [miniopterid betaherpesvirus 1]AFK83867.1 b42 [miniopterid betaherpesvirus 1]